MRHTETDTLILGAGAAGMMCAARCTGRVMVIDHAAKPGEKIRISGGGRCNFTNLGVEPARFVSHNPHFAKSALARYTQWDFIDLVDRHGIAWHEKTLGQLFCDGKSTQVVDMLRAEMAHADLRLDTSLTSLAHNGAQFEARLARNGRDERVTARAVVLATGGKSIPKMGATGLAYDLARQFGLRVTDTRPALVPLTFDGQPFAGLSGVATPVTASAGGAAFDEAMLFTHRGLSGPAILQVSTYWREGDGVRIDLDPAGRLAPALRAQRAEAGRVQLSSVLARHLPQRLVQHLAADLGLDRRVADCSDTAIDEVERALRGWTLSPTGSEGYRTAEVTLGGIDTDDLSSKTMEAKTVPGLYAIGEAVDVTGWLGGYNFQWAWSSAVAAAEAITAAR
ncbi:NAD(P)/FAD-dependent oxidoreductase [Pseudaestuariivita atlantica]|uniref:Membrane protein n=1 Tax=Pseudaestuariivita atlantica TaxID=1317121 RepID=A0A0L1JTQ7_9RHOB|nr:aminoacetone oxidase family FAD-binding enzyme [Pseudaestuariivita atlantica]KNG95146.1 membrane protein [Pseudaestuariivita atlantica]